MSDTMWIPQFWVCGTPVPVSELLCQQDLDRAYAVAEVDRIIVHLVNGIL